MLDKDGSVTTDTWNDMFKQRSGELRTGISQIKLMDALVESDANFQVYGTLSNPDDQQLTATIDIDTLPSNSADTATVDAIIDPTVAYPGDGTLPPAADGQRYLILNEVPSDGVWGTAIGNKYDIIQYSEASTAWSVNFDASAAYMGCPEKEHTVKSTCENAGHTWGTVKFTQNAQDSKKWKWNGIEWISAIEANYPVGYWRLYI